MWFIGVEVEQETSAPPPKKNPGSAPALRMFLASLKAFEKHIRGVDLSSHVDNNSSCCDLCKF